MIRLDKLWHPKARMVNTLVIPHLDVRIRSAPPHDWCPGFHWKKTWVHSYEAFQQVCLPGGQQNEDWRQAELWSYVQRKGHGLLQLEQILALQSKYWVFSEVVTSLLGNSLETLIVCLNAIKKLVLQCMLLFLWKKRLFYHVFYFIFFFVSTQIQQNLNVLWKRRTR